MDEARKKGFLPLHETENTEFELDDVTALEEKKNVLEEQLENLRTKLRNNDELAEKRRKPLVENIEGLESEVENLGNAISMAKSSLDGEMPPPGPPWMAWVDNSHFMNLCNLIIALNMLQMFFPNTFPSHINGILNHVFLVWYLFELTSKIVYHHWTLFFGPISDVWWSWLDALVVASGMVELWFFPLLQSAGFLQSASTSQMQYLRLLRLFRLLRLLKVVKLIVNFDVTIITTKEFELFMNAVICLNALVMGLQLDIKWWAWTWVDQLFLVVYVVELSARAKLLGLSFFTDPETITWNYLDLGIVCAGVFDQWLTPLMATIQAHLGGGGGAADHKESHGSAMQLLRFFRLLRVLRLIKLLKAIPPLHRLLVGVMKALESMKWVLALTSLVLYAAAIVFTTMVTKHIIKESEDECLENFGSVATSIFSLFKMMNGDTDVASCFTMSAAGKLLFVNFMVLSNWAILAILTSVVSDNMIQSSMELVDQEKERILELQNDENRVILSNLFLEVDKDGSGTLDEKEWNKVLEDDGLRQVLLEASGLRERDVANLFECLAEEEERDDGRVVKVLQYERLLEALKNHDHAVDHRSIMNLMMRIIKMEKVFNYRFDRLYRHLNQLGAGDPASPTLLRSDTSALR